MFVRGRVTTVGAIGALALGLLISGCSSDSPAAPTPSATAAETMVPAAPVAAEPAETTPPPVETTETPAEPAAPEADAYSQVVDGVVYQGTEKAPVRIGEDTPGQAPAAEAGLVREGSSEYAQAQNKYIAYVFESPGTGVIYKIFGLSRHGSFRELDNKDYSSRTFASLDDALAAPKVVDGRELDRAEYMLFIED